MTGVRRDRGVRVSANAPVEGRETQDRPEVRPIEVRPIEPAERPWASRLVGDHFGSDRVVTGGVMHDTARLPALVAVLGVKPIAVLSYRIDAEDCEVVALVASQQRLGAGTLLLDTVRALARDEGCRRLWLVTTNDNLAAQKFYRERGWSQCAVHPGAVARARALKPEIPLRSDDGIPIEDEIEFDVRIANPQPAEARPTGQTNETRSST